MEIHVKKILFFLLLMIYCTMCMNMFFKFQSVNLFEGNALFIAKLDSVLGCITACHQHTTCCVASYNKSSNECQLLAKKPNVPTTQFVSDTDRKLHEMVSHYFSLIYSITKTYIVYKYIRTWPFFIIIYAVKLFKHNNRDLI